MEREDRFDPFATYFAYPGEGSPEGGIVFLADRGKEDWARLLEHAEVLRFRPGAEMIRAGERDRALYIVVNGTLEVELSDGEGGVQRRSTIPARSVAGEMAFLDDSPRSATVRALTETEVVRLSYESYEALAARYPELGRAIAIDLGRILAARLRQADELIARLDG